MQRFRVEGLGDVGFRIQCLGFRLLEIREWAKP